MTKEQKARLATIRERISTARDKRAQMREALADARKTNDRELVATGEAQLQSAEEAVEYLTRLENAALQQITGGGLASAGRSLANDLGAQQALAEIAASSAPLRANVHVGDFMTLDETLGLTGRMLAALDVPDGGGATGFVGPIAPPAPPTSLLDFFRSVPFETRTADLMRRSGVADAAIQAAGTVKHEASLTYTADSVRAVTVAAWLKANRQDIDDVEALAADIQQALTYGTLRKVEDLLLNGAPADPDGPAVPGILDGATAPTLTATNLADAVGQAKAILLGEGVQVNFVAASPDTVEVEEARTGSDGHYVNTITPDGRIRRLPLVESTALGTGEVLIGDSRNAALGVRQGIAVIVGQESDDMTRNRVTILAEGRWTPLVSVPTAFAHFTLPVAP
jgi:hypothetical protein